MNYIISDGTWTLVRWKYYWFCCLSQVGLDSLLSTGHRNVVILLKCLGALLLLLSRDKLNQDNLMYLDNCSQVSVSCIQIQIDISSRLFHLDVFAVTLLCHKYTPKDKKCPFALSFVFMASESHGKVTTSRWKSQGLTTITTPRHDAQHPRGGGREVCGSPGRSDRAHTEHRQQHHGDHQQERQGRGENGHSFCLSLSRLSQ